MKKLLIGTALATSVAASALASKGEDQGGG